MNFANRADQSPFTRALLAGLQAGVIGSLAMLAWLGVSAIWQRRGFWSAANLMATCFSRDGPIPTGFTRATVSGLAVYVMIYGLLGAVFALMRIRRESRVRLMLLGIVFALAWYYVAFDLLWKKLAPLVATFHPERSTVIGHLIYGGLLARVARYQTPGQGT
jgi:hypothetical protein